MSHVQSRTGQEVVRTIYATPHQILPLCLVPAVPVSVLEPYHDLHAMYVMYLTPSLRHPVQYSPVQYSTVPYNTIQYNRPYRRGNPLPIFHQNRDDGDLTFVLPVLGLADAGSGWLWFCGADRCFGSIPDAASEVGTLVREGD